MFRAEKSIHLVRVRRSQRCAAGGVETGSRHSRKRVMRASPGADTRRAAEIPVGQQRVIRKRDRVGVLQKTKRDRAGSYFTEIVRPNDGAVHLNGRVNQDDRSLHRQSLHALSGSRHPQSKKLARLSRNRNRIAHGFSVYTTSLLSYTAARTTIEWGHPCAGAWTAHVTWRNPPHPRRVPVPGQAWVTSPRLAPAGRRR